MSAPSQKPKRKAKRYPVQTRAAPIFQRRTSMVKKIVSGIVLSVVLVACAAHVKNGGIATSPGSVPQCGSGSGQASDCQK